MNKKIKIMFLCTGNSCRSQMAEGFGKYFGGDLVEIYSSGIEAHGINQKAVKVMKEIGVDISKNSSNEIDQNLLNKMDYVITLCSDAEDRCPTISNEIKKLHWPFEDPAIFKGTEEQTLEQFRKVRDLIKTQIKLFFNELQIRQLKKDESNE